jgi:hypothetical protein
MEKNEGKLDRIIRLIVGLVALYLSIKYSLWWLVLAIPALLTALTGFCWPYKLLRINTTGKKVIAVKKSKKKKL